MAMQTTDGALTPGQVEDSYYQILAGGARYVLFSSLLDMNLPPLLSEKGRTAEEIIAALKLPEHRGRKWLHALRLTGLLVAESGSEEAAPRLRLSDALRRMFGDSGSEGWFYREFLRYYRVSMLHPLYSVLTGEKIAQTVRYPPTEHADMLLLHEWMRNTALCTLEVIRRHVDFSPVRQLLDVAGGDGTMAFELYKAYPELTITVFNLPGPAQIVQEQAAERGAWDRVSALRGDFRVDPLPLGNDMVMFSRVLADWPPELCQELLHKAHRALLPDGKLVICEPLSDENPDLAIVWEQSYLPYDDFGLQVYKPLSLYQQMLEKAGFKILSVHPRDESTIHCVIVSQRLGGP